MIDNQSSYAASYFFPDNLEIIQKQSCFSMFRKECRVYVYPFDIILSINLKANIVFERLLRYSICEQYDGAVIFSALFHYIQFRLCTVNCVLVAVLHTEIVHLPTKNCSS